LPHDQNGQAKKRNTDSEAAEDAHGAAQPIAYHASLAPVIERGIKPDFTPVKWGLK
jgi:hypothetical protein